MTNPAPHGIGHNRGPDLSGAGFRAHCWRVARADLLPVLPLEVVRLQVRRARALGLPYKTYAGVRATTGRDLVAFLFSSNGLGVFRDGQRVGPADAAILARIEVERHLGTAPGLSPVRLAAALDGAGIAITSARPLPPFGANWGAMRADAKDWLARHKLPGDAVLMIGETAHEAEMAMAGGFAGFVSGRTYFAESAQP